MKITTSTRKPVDKLTLSDFNTFPVWEYALHEEDAVGWDETTVRPVKGSEVPLNSVSQLVATYFTTRAELKLEGFMMVSTADDIVEVTPGVILKENIYGILPSVSREEATAQNWIWAIQDRMNLIQVLRINESELFPLRYSLRVRIQGETLARSGIIF